ncbi:MULTISPECIES: hypothetical protein [unclassified Pseudomonas]|uniref:hypothetical protein n=1 Tax=unclassified Pseudomonas TaxID=196821 RepID=UPI0022491F15|nr:hypothetical protein [Pseudomonas sp. DCB_BG]MCX2708362.1 hypothetical protein [Pseudomonas sp. DCB_BG]
MTTQITTEEKVAKVVELRKQGMSRAKIVAATGFSERFVRTHMEGVEVEKAPTTPFELAVSRAYPLAVRPQGIKEYELRNLCFEVYGSKWDEEKGVYTVAYNKDTLYRIKQRCAELAKDTDSSPLFVMDWVCDEAPTESRVHLEQAALELERHIADLVHEFMNQYATGVEADQLESTEAQRKQAYAARRHILKLAIKEYTPESTEGLLARSLSLTDALDDTSDMEAPTVMVSPTHRSHSTTEAVKDNGSIDAFYDAWETDVAIAEQTVAKPEAPIVVMPMTTHVEQLPDDNDFFGSVADYIPQFDGGHIEEHHQRQ